MALPQSLFFFFGWRGHGRRSCRGGWAVYLRTLTRTRLWCCAAAIRCKDARASKACLPATRRPRQAGRPPSRSGAARSPPRRSRHTWRPRDDGSSFRGRAMRRRLAAAQMGRTGQPATDAAARRLAHRSAKLLDSPWYSRCGKTRSLKAVVHALWGTTRATTDNLHHLCQL